MRKHDCRFDCLSEIAVRETKWNLESISDSYLPSSRENIERNARDRLVSIYVIWGGDCIPRKIRYVCHACGKSGDYTNAETHISTSMHKISLKNLKRVPCFCPIGGKK